MDEQITDVEQTGVEQTGHYDRRQVLRRGAIVVGAATLWTTPVVQSLGMRPAAAGTADETDNGGSLCPSGSGQPRDLIFRWNGAGGASTALIVIQRPGSDRLCTTVGSRGFFQVANQAGSNWRVGIYDPADAPSFSSAGTWKNLPGGGALLDSSEFHTSCSQPLNLGDTFGTITLVAGTAAGDGQRQQVLSGVSLSSVQVATSDCAVHATDADAEAEEVAEPEVEEVAEPELEKTDEPEAEKAEEIAEAQEPEPDDEGLKTGDVEVEDKGVETTRVETEKDEAPRAADDESDDPDVGASS